MAAQANLDEKKAKLDSAALEPIVVVGFYVDVDVVMRSAMHSPASAVVNGSRKRKNSEAAGDDADG